VRDTVPTIPSDASLLDELREILLRNADEMRRTLGPKTNSLPLIDAEVYARRVGDVCTDAAALAQLFVLGKPVPAARLTPALRPLAPQALVEMNLAERERDLVRPLVRITSLDRILIASDILSGPQPVNVVPGPSPSTERVEQLTIRLPAKRTLDLGTGSGIQALLAARHCAEVMGVDVNERALAFARFNARLNGTSNVHWRAGDWLQPVGGERFDLIVANPPYVISPDTSMLYRDSGLPGDTVTLKLLREAPAHLEEGGFAQVMGNWIHRRDEDWRAPLEASIAGSGCDALFLKFASVDLPLYAAHWNSSIIAVEGTAQYLAAVDRWLDYYQRQGIEAIADGLIVLRRRAAASHWVRAIEVLGMPTGRAGDHVLRLFHARDRRDVLADDAAILSTRFATAPGLKVVSRAQGERLAQRSLNVELECGVGFSVRVRPDVADLLFALDGDRPLRELCRDAVDDVADIRKLFALGLVVVS
jgi:methylase of polypeptide subunit release factors